MRLADVADAAGARHAGHEFAGVDVAGISQDSRTVRPGDMYVAMPGGRHHGADFAGEAAANGAVAMLSDVVSEQLPTLLVPDVRRAVGPLASWLYGRPSAALDLYGVTGTNGKTSTAYLLDAGLRAAGHTAGLVTGVEVRGPNGSRRATHTTPEAAELQRTLADFVAHDVTAAAMEVSSHALALHRTAGTTYRVGIFTNLGRDHLDFHHDMDDYYAAKASLFTAASCRSAVIGIDDEFGRRLAKEVEIAHATFSATDTGADFYVDRIHADGAGTGFALSSDQGAVPVRLKLLGSHQADNAAARRSPPSSPAVSTWRPQRGVWRACTWCRAGWNESTRGNRFSRSSTTCTTRPVSNGSSRTCAR